MKNKIIQKLYKDSCPYQPSFSLSFFKPKYWLTWLLALLLWLLSFIPWFMRSAVAMPIAGLAYHFSRKRRRIAQINLALCFADKSAEEIARLLKQHFYARIRIVLDYGFLWFRSARRIRRLVKLDNESLFNQRFQQGKPVIFLSCHTLALDFGAAGLTVDYPGVGLVKPVKNKLADWLMQRGRMRFNAILFTRDDGIRPVVKAVKQGLFFYYLPDEDLEGKDSVFSSFFGVQALTLTSLGRLSSLCDADILPSVTYYAFGKGYYVNRILPLVEGLPAGSREQDALRLNQEVEKLIMLEPSQYMWSMKRFNRRPEGEHSVYD